MKGSISVDPFFQNLNIRKATVHLLKPVVACDPHHLYLGNRFIPWDPVERSIINCTFSEEYKTLMVLCDDWKLYVFNQNLEKIAILQNWESKYTVGFQLLQSLGVLLLIGVGEVELLRMRINTNIKRTKFLSSVSFTIQKLKKISVDSKTKLKWNKGYGYDLQSDLLFVWSLQDINFYKLSTLELKSALRKVVRKEEPITFVYFSFSYQYTLTGLINGNLKVWRLPLHRVDLQTQTNDYILIHNCQRHSKAIQKIVGSKDDRVVFSQGSDLLVCMWSLQTFQLLRVYDFQEEYSKIILHDFRGGLAVKDHYLGSLKFGKTMQFITDLTSSINSHDKNYQKVFQLHVQQGKSQTNRIVSTQLTMGSNIALQIHNADLKKKDLNKISIRHFYPPLGSQEIRQVVSSPFHDNRYYLLTQTGKVYKVRMQESASMIEQYYNIHLTHDVENHPLAQMPTLLKFLQLLPPEFDSQIIDSTIIDKTINRQNKIIQKDQQNSQQKFQKLKLICIGCSKGSVVFLPTDNMDHIYTRVTYHRSQIIALDSVCLQKPSGCLLSICQEYHLKMIQFNDDKAHCFRTILLDPTSFSFTSGFKNHLAVVIKGGIFQVFQLNEQISFFYIQNYDSIDHDGEILSLDWEQSRNILLTGGSDNRIKIWTCHKILLYQIFLDQGLKFAVFSNDLQVLVSHQGKLLYLRELGFQVTYAQVLQIENNFLENADQRVVYLQSFLQKAKTNLQPSKNRKCQRRREYQEMNINQEYLKIKNSMQIDRNLNKNKATKIYKKVKNNSSPQASFSMNSEKGKSLSIELPHQFDEQQFPKYNLQKTQRQGHLYHKTKKKSTNKKRARSTVRNFQKSQRLKGFEQSQTNASLVSENDLKSTRKHLEEMQFLRMQVNQPVLPRIKAKKKDIFDEFMQEKLMQKKVLTRRDITLNRIIMKNIVKDHIGAQTEAITGLKFDF